MRDQAQTYVQDKRFWNPISLKWAGPYGEEKDVEAGVPEKIDLVHHREDQKGVAILGAVNHDRPGVPTTLSAGTYRLKVRVIGEGCLPAEKNFEIVVGDRWDELTMVEVP